MSKHAAGQRTSQGNGDWVTKSMLAPVTLAIVVLVGIQQPANAITAEIAKKCRELSVKAFPMDRNGTTTAPPKPNAIKPTMTKPTVASATSAKSRQEYFRACLAKDGKVQ